MSRVKIELNLEGINELMKSPEIQASLEAAGAAVAAQASDIAGGAAYDHSVHLADWVAIENVWPADPAARRDNLDNNTLIKAVGNVGLPLSKK